jgi:hypothetical protein
MSSLIDALPGQAQKDSLLDSFNEAISPDTLGLDVFDSLGVDTLTDTFAIDDLPRIHIDALPPLPPGLTKAGLLQQITEPLAHIQSIDAATLLAEIESSVLAPLPKPTFRISEAASQITGAIVPVFTSPSFNLPDGSFGQELFDLSGLETPFQQLAQAGAATPLRLLDVLLNTLNALVATITDADKLASFTAQSLQEIYLQQLDRLDGRLPLVAVEQAIAICQETEDDDGYSSGLAARYSLLLDQIELIGDGDRELVSALAEEADASLLPDLEALRQAHTTLGLLLANDVAELNQALTRVLDLNATDAVFVQPTIDAFGRRASQVLDAIAAPVNQIRRMAQQIQQYLERTATAAESSAQQFSSQITSTLQQIESWIQEIERRILAIQAQIESVVARLDVTALIEQAKAGCAKISETVDAFFDRLQTLQQKLDLMVRNLAQQVDDKVTAAFAALEQKIRDLLAEIMALLEREDVRQALQQASDGIETFKNAIEQASLQPIFDLVLSKTNDLEASIKRIDVAQMGTPQRTALKVSAKVLQEVRVDEVIKPELMEEFEEIRAPLTAILALIREKVNLLTEQIYQFQPGTLISELLKDSLPYEVLMSTLDSFRPSELLAPIKALNEKVTEIADALDPNKLIDAVQSIYNQLAELLDVLNPVPLNRLIGDALGTATPQLALLRDQKLGELMGTIQQTISLERLMANTPIREIADAQFWQILANVLGGRYLTLISEAMAAAEERLSSSEQEDVRAWDRLQEVMVNVNRQRKLDVPLFALRVTDLTSTLANDRFQALQDRRGALLRHYADDPEVAWILGTLDLKPVLHLQGTTAAVGKMPKTRLKASLAAVNSALAIQADALQQIDAAALHKMAVTVFRLQIGDPVRALISLLQTKLAPFQEAVVAIQAIIDTVVAMPARIDASVATVLTATQESVHSLLTQLITSIDASGTALTSTLETIYERVKWNVDQLSPAWILNAFAVSDFVGAPVVEDQASTSDLSTAVEPAADAVDAADYIDVADISEAAAESVVDEDVAPTQGLSVTTARPVYNPPMGMLRMAERIVLGGAQDTVNLGAFLQAQLTAEELGILEAGVERARQEPGSALLPGAGAAVLNALNRALTQTTLIDDTIYMDDLKTRLVTQVEEVETQKQATLADANATVERRVALTKQVRRLGALQRQIGRAEERYRNRSQYADLLRLNRVLLEAECPDDVNMSLQSLHPYAVEQIAHLYPEDTVAVLDTTYISVVDKIRNLPDQLIAGPLNDTFLEVTQVLQEYFDIDSIFAVLNNKLDGLDEDLDLGLDRLSAAYERLLVTFDRQMSAA